MNNRLYVGNLSYDVTSNSLRSAFAECGEVGDLKIIMDRETGRARGFAFVTMSTEAEATFAIERMNNSMLDGRALRVNLAEERGARNDGPRRGGHKGW